MLRIDNSSQQNPSLLEAVLPPEIFQMNEELTRVDRLLDAECFFAPFRERLKALAADRGFYSKASED